MALFDKFKDLFKKKDVPLEQVNQVTRTSSLRSQHQESLVSDGLEEHQPVLTLRSNNTEASNILNTLKLNFKALALDRLESEADAINSYLKGLIKDLTIYQTVKPDKIKVEEAISSISGKIKLITIHGLELKNLLAGLEDHYYSPLIDALKKVYLHVSREEIRVLIETLDQELALVKDLDSQVTRVIGYNDLFNPDKNPKYKEEIEKEALKRVVHGDLNDLIDKILIRLIDKSLSLKLKIEKSNYLAQVKTFI